MSTSKLFSIIVRAKGDLLVGTSADDLDRLPVGNNGQVLTANSATATGLAWSNPSEGGGGPALSNANPANLGTTAPGVGTEASRADHVHDMPSAVEVGADVSGAAASAVTAHTNATNPHPEYLTPAEGDLAYSLLGHIHSSAGDVSVVSHYVKNDAIAKSKGAAVYISSANGAHPIVSYADADFEASSSKTFGLLAQDLAANAFGYVITEGTITGIDTNNAGAGDKVWLSTTAGGRVYGNPPAKPAHSVLLGYVTRANQNNGEMIIFVQNGYELGEIDNVSLSNGNDTTGNVLSYNATTKLWGASSALNDLITTVSNKVASVSATAPITSTGGTAPTIAINNASTSAKGAVQLEDSTSSTSTSKAATPASVKSAYDLAAAAIPKSIVDAKGDIIAATADNTPARIAIGADGYHLSADATAATGLAWVPAGSDVQEFTGNGTWTKPTGAKAVAFLLIGGGGGGAGGARTSSNATMYAGPGGAGSQALSMVLPATAFGSTASVVIGAGGSAGVGRTGTNGNGTAGGDGNPSSFGNFQVGGGAGAAVNSGTNVWAITAKRPGMLTANTSGAFPSFGSNTNHYDGMSVPPAGTPTTVVDALYGPGAGGQGGYGNTSSGSGSSGPSARGSYGFGLTTGSGAVVYNGAAGNAATGLGCGGSGGGGGYAQAGGAGGAGYRGGGGGGGGSGTTAGGNGAVGGDGYLLVITLR